MVKGKNTLAIHPNVSHLKQNSIFKKWIKHPDEISFTYTHSGFRVPSIICSAILLTCYGQHLQVMSQLFQLIDYNLKWEMIDKEEIQLPHNYCRIKKYFP
jgi:hypothetical protein